MRTDSIKRLVLASESSSRANVLRNAGVVFSRDPARIDETEITASMIAAGAQPRDIAVTLAELKAKRVSGRHPGAFCLGADQVLELNGKLFSKPVSKEEARQQLYELRGNVHQLHTALVIVQDHLEIWRHVERARLWMRSFSEEFLEDYLNREGQDDGYTVGAYRLEDVGVQLFDRVQGDFFSILGLPLLPLLAFLRVRGIAST